MLGGDLCPCAYTINRSGDAEIKTRGCVGKTLARHGWVGEGAMFPFSFSSDPGGHRPGPSVKGLTTDAAKPVAGSLAHRAAGAQRNSNEGMPLLSHKAEENRRQVARHKSSDYGARYLQQVGMNRPRPRPLPMHGRMGLATVRSRLSMRPTSIRTRSRKRPPRCLPMLSRIVASD